MKMKKVNLGCASNLLDGYINVDMDSLDDIKRRYPNLTIPTTADFVQSSIFELPFEEESLDEIRSDCLIEHLSFKEEKIFFTNIPKFLKKGGKLNLSTPDFEIIVKTWLAAEDQWKDFFRDDDDAIKSSHWFGTYTYGHENRWGQLSACIFGPQNSVGQFHKNCYTENKLKAIFERVGFENLIISRYKWKGNRETIIRIEGTKI